MSAPREEHELIAELATLDKAITAATGPQAAGPVLARARARLEAALAEAEGAAVDSGKPWSPPTWLKDRAHVWSNPQRAAEEAGAALDEVDAIATRGGLRLGAVSSVVRDAADGADPAGLNYADVDGLREQRAAVEVELAERRRGAGAAKPYRLSDGSHARHEAGVGLRIYKPGATIFLDRWQAAQLEGRVQPLEEPTAAAERGEPSMSVMV